jgi:hypothetical protein
MLGKTMSESDFIQTADKALASYLWNNIKNQTENQAVISGIEQIGFSLPKSAQASKTQKLALCLYHVTPEPQARNQPAPHGQGRPQAAFALHYLIVPMTGSEEKDHALLGAIIQAVSASPIIAGNVELAVKIDSLPLEDLTRLWIALDAPFRLSASVTVLAKTAYTTQIESQAILAVSAPAIGAENITVLYQAVLKTFMEQIGGWKKRNFFQKQYTAQDFKKNTDMGIEEMHAALDGLGDKLELHLSTAQYIKPLTVLAEYYQHQLEQLKGFEKISPKQKENTAMIEGWIKEVKVLIAALSNQLS